MQKYENILHLHNIQERELKTAKAQQASLKSLRDLNLTESLEEKEDILYKVYVRVYNTFFNKRDFVRPEVYFKGKF